MVISSERLVTDGGIFIFLLLNAEARINNI
jgi:hypothetical protein